MRLAVVRSTWPLLLLAPTVVRAERTPIPFEVYTLERAPRPDTLKAGTLPDARSEEATQRLRDGKSFTGGRVHLFALKTEPVNDFETAG